MELSNPWKPLQSLFSFSHGLYFSQESTTLREICAEIVSAVSRNKV